VHAARRSIAAVALLFVLTAAVCGPLLTLFDPDEGYYPATAAETLRSGSFWDLRFNGAPRWEKPILSYAVIEAAFELFGESAGAARLPSALEGAALVAIVGLLVSQLAGPRAGVICAVVVGRTLGVSIFSKIAHPEIAVVLSIVTTELLLCLWLLTSDSRQRRRVAVAVGISIGYGVLVKGPVAVVLPAVALLSALPFIRVARSYAVGDIVDLAWAATVAAGIAAPWYAAMIVRHGWQFVQDAVWQQNVGRYATSTYGHHASVFFLVLPTLAGVWPWVAALPAAIVRVQFKAGSRREILRVCMFGSAVSALVFYSLSTSKLASYALVCIPPLAIMVGLLLDDDFDDQAAMARTSVRTALMLAVCAIVLAFAPLEAQHVLTPRQLLGGIRPADTDVGALIAPLTIPLECLAAAAVVVLILARSSRWRVGTIAAVGALAPVLALVAARPVLNTMYPWEAFGKVIASRPAPAWLVGRRAPSLTFYAGRVILFTPDVQALEAAVRQEHAGWVALTHEDWAQFSASAGRDGKEATLVAERGRMALVWFTDSPPRR
jgi:4-amino-4-deoxy-L-arabinose transferase-like glycosyltransferase